MDQTRVKGKYIWGGGGEEIERKVLKTKEMTLGIRESNLRKIIFSAKYQA